MTDVELYGSATKLYVIYSFLFFFQGTHIYIRLLNRVERLTF